MALQYLTDIDLNKNELQNAIVQTVGANPSPTPESGSGTTYNPGDSGLIWFNTSDHYLYYYNGSKAIPIGAINFETNASNIKVAGTASVGSLSTIPRADHVHPAQTSVSGNAGTATTLKTARTIDGVSFNGSANISHFGTCTISGSTGTVACTGYSLSAGSWVAVFFPSTNNTTSTDPLLLNVNGTGGKQIKYYTGSDESIPANANIFCTNRTYLLVYDGSQYYRLVGDLDTHTEYDAGTLAQLEAGTVLQNMVWSPNVLHSYVSTAIGAANAMRFKGTVGTGGTVTTLPTTGVKVGDTYMVKTAGTYDGQTCEVGDLIIATATTPTWTVAQTNITGAITTADASSANPLMDGTATPGTSTKYAREGHVHPTDTTRASVSALESFEQEVANNYISKQTFDEKAVQKATLTNPALTPSGGVATWTATHSLGTKFVEVAIYETSSAKQVMAEVIASTTNACQIKILTTSTIAAGTYTAVIHA